MITQTMSFVHKLRCWTLKFLDLKQPKFICWMFFSDLNYQRSLFCSWKLQCKLGIFFERRRRFPLGTRLLSWLLIWINLNLNHSYLMLSMFSNRTTRPGSQLHNHQHLHDVDESTLLGGLQWRPHAAIYARSSRFADERIASQLFISRSALHRQQFNAERHIFGFRLCIQYEGSKRSDRCASGNASHAREAANRRER